jgi:hypothetical protein
LDHGVEFTIVERFVARRFGNRVGLGNRPLVYVRVAAGHLLDVAAGLCEALDLVGRAGARIDSPVAGSGHSSDRESRIGEVAIAVGVAGG